MTTEQAIKYEDEVIESAKEWIYGENSIDNQIELLMIAEYYNVRLPSCCHHFIYSDSPNDLCATGAFKTLYKVLDKLKNAIIKKEGL